MGYIYPPENIYPAELFRERIPNCLNYVLSSPKTAIFTCSKILQCSWKNFYASYPEISSGTPDRIITNDLIVVFASQIKKNRGRC